MKSVTNRALRPREAACADEQEIGLGQVPQYFCGTSHLTVGVYVGIAGTQDCYQGVESDRYIVIDASPRGVEIRSAADAREVAAKILSLADEYEALTGHR